MRESVKILRQALDPLPDGPVNVDDRKMLPPPREELETSMEAVIHHFKLFTEGYSRPAGDAYVASRVGPRRERLLHRQRRHPQAASASSSAPRPSSTSRPSSAWRSTTWSPT